jgi:hypothetical protein
MKGKGKEKAKRNQAQFPIPNSQFPIPNSQFPITNFDYANPTSSINYAPPDESAENCCFYGLG